YLKILMDEIFGIKNFINMITVKAKIAGVSGSHQGKSLQNNCEYILMYTKDPDKFLLEKSPQKEQELMQYIDQLQNDGVSWKYVQVLTDPGTPQFIGETVDGSGNPIKMFE